jgi:hypothetical protein
VKDTGNAYFLAGDFVAQFIPANDNPSHGPVRSRLDPLTNPRLPQQAGWRPVSDCIARSAALGLLAARNT